MEQFIKSSLELGKELLDKDELTQREEEFLRDLNIVVNQYMK